MTDGVFYVAPFFCLFDFTLVLAMQRIPSGVCGAAFNLGARHAPTFPMTL
jgi:ABC-type spermidine/putrescine transport system permease subunit I